MGVGKPFSDEATELVKQESLDTYCVQTTVNSWSRELTGEKEFESLEGCEDLRGANISH